MQWKKIDGRQVSVVPHVGTFTVHKGASGAWCVSDGTSRFAWCDLMRQAKDRALAWAIERAAARPVTLVHHLLRRLPAEDGVRALLFRELWVNLLYPINRLYTDETTFYLRAAKNVHAARDGRYGAVIGKIAADACENPSLLPILIDACEDWDKPLLAKDARACYEDYNFSLSGKGAL